MKKIEAIIRPERLQAVKSALSEAGITGMTASNVRGLDQAGGQRPKIRLELTVPDEAVDDVIEILLEQARTGEEGDGKIFVLPAAEARSIRTGVSGEGAL